MDLSAREAATLLGRNLRTVRGQLARGDLPGTKRNGRWVVRRQDLPLTEAQRRRLQAKANRIRRTVDEALPSRSAKTPGDRSRSLADLDAFRLGVELLAEIQANGDLLDEEPRGRISTALEQSLLALAEAAFQFDREVKLEAVNRARGALARSAGSLFLLAGLEPREPMARWLAVLEGEMLPAVAGFARWTDRLGRAPR